MGPDSPLKCAARAHPFLARSGHVPADFRVGSAACVGAGRTWLRGPRHWRAVETYEHNGKKVRKCELLGSRMGELAGIASRG